MSTHDTTQDTLTDRLASTATVALLECEEISNSPGSWLRPVVLSIQGILAAELIARKVAVEDKQQPLIETAAVEMPARTADATPRRKTKR